MFNLDGIVISCFFIIFQGVANVAAVCLAIGYPTLASAPHMLINGFKNLLALAAVTEIEFKEAETMKEYLKVNTTQKRRVESV